MKRVVPVLVTLVAVVGLVGTFWYLWKKSHVPEQTFETATPVKTTIIKKAVATGSVVPRKEVEIRPQVSGIIEALHVEPGAEVKAGDLIATIRVIPNMASLSGAESRVNRARIAKDDADREMQRNRRLHAEGTVSEQLLQQSEVTLAKAKEEMSAAQDGLEIVKKGASSRSTSASNTLVRATVGGMVLEVPVEVGSSVIEANTFNAGTSIATIADMSELIFRGKVDESEVGKLSPGMTLLLTIGAIEGKQFEATLEHVAPKGVLDNGAIKFEIRAALKLQDGAFVRANYSANADVVLDRRDDVLAIDEGLLQFDDGKPFVEVEVAPQQFTKRVVELGLSDGIHVEVLSGLAEGERLKKPRAPAG